MLFSTLIGRDGTAMDLKLRIATLEGVKWMYTQYRMTKSKQVQKLASYLVQVLSPGGTATENPDSHYSHGEQEVGEEEQESRMEHFVQDVMSSCVRHC